MEEKNKNLLKGYVKYDKRSGKEEYVYYSGLMTLGDNIPAKYNLRNDLEDTYHLAYNKDDEKSYLFDHEKQRYIEIDERNLQEFLANNEDIRLDIIDTSKIIKSIVKRINNNYDFIEFNNKLFNLKNYELEDKNLKKEVKGKEYETNKPRPFITPKKINHNILAKKDTNFNPENSIIYQTLKQILGTEENIKDFKQRLGVSIFNKGKEITIYYGKSGDNGKSILLYIRKLVLGILAKTIKAKDLEGDFNHELYNNVHELQFDENKENTFKNTEDTVKKITGGGIEEETRIIHTQKLQKTRINSHIVIATNILPEFNLNDTALFNRISIIELRNKFTYLDDIVDNINVFKIDDNIREKLKEDIEGVECLIYDSIKEYRLMKDKNQILINKKGIEYGRAFYLGNDHLTNFLSVYIEVTEYETENTTATEIYNNYVQYIEDNNIDYILEEEQIVQDIGRKLNKIYGKDNIIRKKEDNTRYLKNIKCTYIIGVEKYYKVDPELEDYNIIDYINKKIFNLIKKGYNTFELLKQQEKDHTQLIESIKYLKENGYIKEEDKLKTNGKQRKNTIKYNQNTV